MLAGPSSSDPLIKSPVLWLRFSSALVRIFLDWPICEARTDEAAIPT
jgi:hypothetical protein